MVGWASLARTLPPGAELVRALETIERNARDQDRMIEDLLDMSRAATGTLRLEVVDVSVDEVVAAAAAALAPAASAKSVRIDVDARAGTIRADGNRLKQVVSNLLSNAVKFTPSSGRVFVGATRDEAEVEIVVRDTGAGIAPEFLPHVYEPFRQGSEGPSRRHGGLGLGLSIVKRLVEAHGGTIRVESAGLDQGTAFFVRLPEVARETAAHPPSGTMRARSA